MSTPFGKLALVFPLLAGMAAGPAYAAEWAIDPTLSAGVGYNDNVRLSDSGDKISSAEASFEPMVVFSRTTARSGIDGKLDFTFRRYEEDSNLDENNTRFRLDAFRGYERSRLGLNLGFVRDTTLDSQLETTGLVFDRVRRQRINGGPNWTYSFSPRTRLRTTYNYVDVEYKNAGDTGFNDYNTHNGSMSLSRVLDERTTFTTSLSAFLSDNENDVETTNLSAQAGFARSFSATLSASLFAGVRRTETDFSQNSTINIFSGNTIIGQVPVSEDITRTDTGFTFDGSVMKTFLRGSTTLSASRDVSDDVNGVPVEVDRIRLNNTYRFSETMSGTLILTYSTTQSTNTAGQSLDRDYFQVQPKFLWQFKKDWRISATYRYRLQTFDDTSDDATQNAAYLTLDYLWPKIAVSR